MFTVSMVRAALVSAIVFSTALSWAAGEQTASRRVEAELLDGTRYSLNDSRGAITVLSFWSPDSLASRKCIWELQRFASAFESREVKTIAVSTVKDAELLRAFVAKRKLKLPVAMLEEHNLGPLPDHQLPIVLVFDRDGTLLISRAGMYSYRVLESMVVPLLK